MVQTKAKILSASVDLLKSGSGFYLPSNCPERIFDRFSSQLVVWDTRSFFRILSIFNWWSLRHIILYKIYLRLDMLFKGKMGKALGLIFCSTNREISRNYVILFLSLYIENFKKHL